MLLKDCEDQFLSEVIMRLKLRMFSPGDFVCQKGERCKVGLYKSLHSAILLFYLEFLLKKNASN